MFIHSPLMNLSSRLLAATLGPLANVLSIAALVTSWRIDLQNDGDKLLTELSGVPVADPRWIYWLNLVSLLLGFIGNLFLLMNFTNRIRYILSLPMTIILWYLATGILMAITLSMEMKYTPTRPQQTYSQGYWYAVIAAILYFICSSILLVNMLGYFLGHYPQTFNLTESQRQLILQTMFFFFWLAAGGGIFSAIESGYGEDDWKFVDALYFCDVTILTVGFGDLYPKSDVGRGVVFPYSVVGIILLGLVISSVHGFVQEIGAEKVIMNHIERDRIRTIEKSVSTPLEMRRMQRQHFYAHQRYMKEAVRQGKSLESLPAHPEISYPMNPVPVGDVFGELTTPNSWAALTNKGELEAAAPAEIGRQRKREKARALVQNAREKRTKAKIVLLHEERDRFNAMRQIQQSTQQFKRYSALVFSVIAFGILWCGGAVVFWRTEAQAQDMTYFRAIYFGYVCLLTIGYGDMAPITNPGRCFFVVWSLIAVPTMTVLISDLGNTLIGSYRVFSVRFSNFYLMPEKGAWRNWLNHHPWLLDIMKWLVKAKRRKVDPSLADNPVDNETGRRVDPDGERASGNDDDMQLRRPTTTINALAKEAEEDEKLAPSRQNLACGLANAIRRVAGDLKTEEDRQYPYEDWVEFTRLIRFTAKTSKKRTGKGHKLDLGGDHASGLDGGEEAEEVQEEEQDEGMVEWDWIGPNSPMTAGVGETEFILDRLCESLVRYLKQDDGAMSSGADGIGK